MRTPFIAGNWKMNPVSEKAAVELAQAVRDGVGTATDVRVAVCPPATYLAAIDKVLENSPVGVGGQDMHWEASGAYTGSISGPMLIDAGCTHVILGHSERRHGLGETDAMINKKLHAALEHKLLPIVCIGETLEEREANRTLAVIEAQLNGSLEGITEEQMPAIVLAYEPVWAIGTGKTATPDQAQEVHAQVRGWLAGKFSQAIADRVIVQYGGSMKPENAGDLLSRPDIDGGLIGGAALKAESFLGIVQAARDSLAR